MASNSRSYVLLAFVIGVVAVYGQYGGDAPSYPAQPPTVPIFVPYPAPPPPILPELPASHEILRPRHRHHHRRRHHSKSKSWSSESKSKSKSNSDSREHRHHCKDCKKIKKSCAGAEGNNCFTPDIYYFEYKGCRRAVITCDATIPVKLETTQGAALTSSLGGQKIARCDKHNNWVSRDENGDKVDFSTVRCIPIIVEA